jgi:hypothetical protein
MQSPLTAAVSAHFAACTPAPRALAACPRGIPLAAGNCVSTLEAFLPLFEPEILGKLASKKAFATGQELFDAGRAVNDIVFAGDTLRGKVKGSHPQPHQATLRLLADGTLEASCTCPTFTDGWERICHHAVALALSVRKQYQTGAEITLTQNPWVQDVASSNHANQQRYQVEVRKGHWHVMVFKGGGTPVAGRKRYEGMSPADRIIQHYLDQEVDDCDDGGHVIDDAALAGMLYFARSGSTVSIKGVGKLQFGPEPLVLRIKAEARPHDASVVLHAFLEQRSTGRTIEVNSGRVIVGAPTWFLLPETAEVFLIPDTPPWVLEAVGRSRASSWTRGSRPSRWTRCRRRCTRSACRSRTCSRWPRTRGRSTASSPASRATPARLRSPWRPATAT